MPLKEQIEQVVHWASQLGDGEELSLARERFEKRTAPIEIDQADYEARIGHFLDWFICQHGSPDRPPPVATFAETQDSLPPDDRWTLAALARSQRSLYRVEQPGEPTRLLDLLRGAVFLVSEAGDDKQLAAGDIFDGRVLAGPHGPALMPGRVFHPASAHNPLLALVAEAKSQGVACDTLLDSTLGMRDRLRRFTRVRAEHLYTFTALGSDAFSAPWMQSPPVKGE